MSDIVYKKIGFSTPFLRGYRKLKIPIIDNAGNPVWPELFPLLRIDALRSTVGHRHFSAQMMLDYVPADRARLDPVALHMYSDEFDAATARIGDNQITGGVMYWDPSCGHQHSDGSVCVLVFRDDRTQHVFVHDVLYLTVPDGTLHPMGFQCDRVLDFCAQYNMHRISIETNGLGNTLPEIMHDVATRRGTRIYVQKIVNNKNKETRILDAIEPVLSTGRMHMHTRVQKTPLIAEMLGWSPLGGNGHDDGIDALAGAIAALATTIRPTVGHTTIFTANTEFKL